MSPVDEERAREEEPGRTGTLAAARTALALAALLVALVAWVGVPVAAGRGIAFVVRREAAARGIPLRLVDATFRWLGPASLRGVEVRRADGTGFSAAEVLVSWRVFAWSLAGHVRGIGLRGLSFDLPAGLGGRVADSDWTIERVAGGEFRVSRRGTRQSVTLSRGGGGPGDSLRADFRRLDLGSLLQVARRGTPLPRPGRWTGVVTGRREPTGLLRGEAMLSVDGTQLPSLAEPGTGAAWGEPFDARLALEAILLPGGEAGAAALEVPCWKVETSAVSAHGTLSLVLSDDDAWVDLDVEEGRLDLAAALAASGTPRPAVLAGVPSLGAATLAWSVEGAVSRPAEVEVAQELDFEPPAAAVTAVARYNGPFTHEAPLPGGGTLAVRVDPASPGYVPLAEVPPLLVRALLVAEDASFWSHRGIDLSAIPAALAMNLRDGSNPRGGSTISQQLAKNLFLSREKTYSRKLQELALTLLLESALPKRRILEIYLNVIEWGPGIYGLRPAARHYFGKEPRDLTPKEIAFLVALVPGPLKYQASFAGGVLRPGFERLVTRVLAMLRSVDALTEEEYLAARDEAPAFREGLFAEKGGDREEEEPVSPPSGEP